MPDRRALSLAHGYLALPAFLPDATHGTVRTLDSLDVASCGVQAVVMNVFHLMQRPGSSTVRACGGLHRLFAWPGPIMTDSGGFQAYSLIRQNPRYGAMTERGIVFRPEGSERKVQLTPEKCVALQMSYGADIVVCLDDCTDASTPLAEQRESVRRTIAWARRCRAEYDWRLAAPCTDGGARPLLFGVVQCWNEPDLRRECAEALLEIGFDGYGLGGWPLDAHGHLLAYMTALTRALIPAEYPLHGLGIGHPDHVLALWRMGYDMFDASMPTRDARHGRLLVRSENTGIGDDGWFRYLYIGDELHIKSTRPLSEVCDCLACRHYSRAMLHHLYAIRDGLYFRLATMHNLRFMASLMTSLQEGAVAR